MNHYETLGVGKDATAAQIKAAYRKKAKTAHPDAGGSAADFEALSAAYKVLSDADERAYYDEHGKPREKIETLQDRAMAFILEGLQLVLLEDDVLTRDPLASMRKSLTVEMIPNLKAKIEKHRKKIAHLGKVRSKVTIKGDEVPNFIVGFIGQQIEALERSITVAEGTLEMMGEADRILGLFDYEVDQPGETREFVPKTVDEHILRIAREAGFYGAGFFKTAT